MAHTILLGLLTFAASGIGTATGFGTSTVMIPVMALFVSHPVALLFVGVIHVFGDLFQKTVKAAGERGAIRPFDRGRPVG